MVVSAMSEVEESSVFIGRHEQLGRLDAMLQRARTKANAKPGAALLIRGRRRVGKSRLVEEFVSHAGVPYLFYAAAGRPVAEELRLFAEEVAASNLPGAGTFRDIELGSWDAALRLLATAVPDDGCVLVFDELPYLIERDPGFEGSLQAAFDRELSRRRVLLIGIGSDLAMMETLNEYGRPFYQRASEMVVPPLSPPEVADMLDLESADAFDAYLVTGGLPLICDEWTRGRTLQQYLADALADPTSALVVSAERALAAEFPTEAQARDVLATIGGTGERTFTGIANKAGVNASAVQRATDILTAKRMVAADRPLSAKASRETRYRVADPYMRFWLTFVGPNMQLIERGRGGTILDRLAVSWSSWRGRAIEPVIRESVERLALPVGPDGAAGVVGGYWTRTNNPEIDLVIADRGPVAKRIYAAGSIKWLDSAFDSSDLGALLAHHEQLPGADRSTSLVVVSRSGYEAASMPELRVLGPEDLLGAWQSPA